MNFSELFIVTFSFLVQERDIKEIRIKILLLKIILFNFSDFVLHSNDQHYDGFGVILELIY